MIMNTVTGFQNLLNELFRGSTFLSGRTFEERLECLARYNWTNDIAFNFEDIEEDVLCLKEDDLDYCPGYFLNAAATTMHIEVENLYEKDTIKPATWLRWFHLRNLLEIALLDERVRFKWEGNSAMNG